MITMLIMISEWLQWILYFVQNFFKQNILKQTNSSNNHNNNGNDDDNLISNSTSQTSYENIISLTFYYAWHVITRKINHNYPDVRKNVLKSESVTRAIEQVSCDQYRIKTLTKQQQVKNICHKDVKNENEYQQFIRKNRHKAFELYEELSSCISSSLLRIAGWILYRLLSRMFNSVQFSKAQIEQIRQRQKLFDNKNKQQQQQQKSDIPIIYLPLHRSYLDCILITFILSMNGLNPPLIAINDHCCLPFFDNLIRGLGAFFIRKKCIKNNNNVKADHGNNNNNVNNNNNNNNDDDDNENDPIHKAILRSYIIENLRQGNSMEFFLEDSRTSTGKVLMPNLHLLSIVLDALAEGSVQQVCIVPVSISYEKSIEGTNLVVREQMDLPQQQQQQQRKSSDTFITTIMAIWKTLRSNYGAVRVDFGKPFILNEYMNQCMAQQQIQQQLENEQRIKQQQQQTMNDNDLADNHHHHNDHNKLYPIPRKIDYGVTIADCVACPPSLDRITHCKKNNSLSLSAIKLLNNNNNNNNNIDDKKNDGLDEEIRRRYRCCDSLAKHVLYDAYRDSSLMSTHLVSFLLLNKYRSKGTTIEQLSQDLDWLRQTICRDKQQNLSINGDSQTLVRQAIQLLRQEELIQTEKVRLKWSSWNNNNHYSRNYHQRNSWNQCNNNDNDGVYDDDDNNKSDSRLEIIYLKPSNKLASLLHLQHYSNYCSSLFVFESVLAISLHTFVQQTEISSLIYDPSTFVSNLSINKREFFQRCRTICSLLQNEFIFTKSCQSLDHMLAKTFIDSFCKHDIFVLNPNKPTGLTLPMSDVANHLYPNNHHHHQNGTNNHHSSSSSTIIKTGKNLPVSYRRLNRWLTSSTRRRRSSMFKNMEGTLQNECILEVDEDRLIDNDNNDDDDEIMDVIDCISDHSLSSSSSSSSSTDDNEDNNNNNHHLPQEFYIRLTEKNCQLLSLYRSILEPYVQAYWFVADCIANYNELSSSSSSSSLKLMNDTKCINYHNQPKNCQHKIIMNINSEQFKQQKYTMANGHSNGYKPIIMDNNNNNNNNNIINIDEKILLKMLITQAKQMAHNGYIYYECASKQTLQNALKFFSSLDNGEDDIMNDLNNDVKQQQYTTTTTTINLERIQAIAESMKIFIRNDKTQSTKSS